MNSRSRRFAASLVAVVGLVAAGCSTTPGGPEPQAPVAAITAVPTTGTSPLTVDFGSVGSNDPDGTISSYSWNFGDGSPLASGPGATHTYTTPNVYTATLVVTDNSGMTGSANVSINVLDPGSGCAANPDPLDANGEDTNCDGVDGIAAAQVLVDAASGSDIGACGNAVKPCATIANGVATAAASGKSIVLVSAGDYDAFDISNGITLRGGYNDTFNGRIAAGTRVHGTYDSATNTNYGVRASSITSVTKLVDLKINAEGSAGKAASGVIVKNASAKVVLDNVTATAGQGLNPTGVLANNNSKVEILSSTISSGTALGAGSSAYGVRALNGSNVTVNGGTITAAAGNNASDSSASTPATPAAACSGGNGMNGNLVTGALINSVGGASCNPWFTTTTNGGNGGNGYFSQAGDPGIAGSQGIGAAGGSGGCGSAFSCGTPAEGGSGGAGGAGGAAGAAGTNNFASAGDLWVGGKGGNGHNGGEGGGGGGGGGGASASAFGGGGGAGGAGGASGLAATDGGAAGGGSFGVYAVDSTASLTNVTVTVASGGNGGKGSAGGAGGNGGNGGAGGDKQCCEAGGGGGGGAGAGGGGGSGAGGGAGGPSIAVLHNGTGSLTTTSVVTNLPATAGNGGAGGAGGAGGVKGAVGAGGAGTGTFGTNRNGGTGGTATNGSAGATGETGQAGQVLRYWDNGTATP